MDTGLLDVSINALNRFVDKTTDYKCNASKFKNIVNSVESKKISLDKIGNPIYKVGQKKNPKYIYQISRNKLLLLLNFLPKRLQNKIIKIS